MKDIYPLYCNEFKCIADKCPDTCCALWEIVIDEKYANLYKSHPSQAAKDAVPAMYTDSDGDICLRHTNGRCPMLNENNLCRLYIEMGEDALCDVCRIYPRFNKETDKVNFCGISLSCPEAARLILSDEHFGELNKIPCFENREYGFIFETFEVFKNLCIKESFIYSSSLADAIQEELDFGDIPEAEKILKTADFDFEKSICQPGMLIERVRFMQSLDILKDSWRETLSCLSAHLETALKDCEYNKKREDTAKEIYSCREIKNAEIYYLYKYLPEAMEYADIYTLVNTAIVCTEVLCELCTMQKLQTGSLDFDNILEFAKDFSKEIEHNGDNMERVCNLSN